MCFFFCLMKSLYPITFSFIKDITFSRPDTGSVCHAPPITGCKVKKGRHETKNEKKNARPCFASCKGVTYVPVLVWFKYTMNSIDIGKEALQYTPLVSKAIVLSSCLLGVGQQKLLPVNAPRHLHFLPQGRHSPSMVQSITYSGLCV